MCTKQEYMYMYILTQMSCIVNLGIFIVKITRRFNTKGKRGDEEKGPPQATLTNLWSNLSLQKKILNK